MLCVSAHKHPRARPGDQSRLRGSKMGAEAAATHHGSRAQPADADHRRVAHCTHGGSIARGRQHRATVCPPLAGGWKGSSGAARGVRVPARAHRRPGEWWEGHLRALRLPYTRPPGPGGSPGARRLAPPPSLRLRRSRLPSQRTAHAARGARRAGRPCVQTAQKGLPADLNLPLTHRLAAPRRQSLQRSA